MSRKPLSAENLRVHRYYGYYSTKEREILEVTSTREMSALVRSLVKKELKQRQTKSEKG